MSTPSNHWKLGLFVVVGIGVFFGMLVFLGAQGLQNKSVRYITYFDESVQGLDVGSPVKFRGVTVGNVAAIDIAPDRRHIQVSCDLAERDLASLGLAEDRSPGKKQIVLPVPPDLRAQIGSSGLVGTKFVQIDFFELKDNPRPSMPFPLPARYIPAASSTMKNLEDAVVKAVDRFPEIADRLLAVMSEAARVLDTIEQEKLPERATATLADANQLLAALRVALTKTDLGQLSSAAQRAIDELSRTVAQLSAMLTRVQSDRGLLASAQRATDTIGDLAGGAKGLGSELQDTLRDVREAVDSIQHLAEALDTDSDMLLKGRAKGRP